MLATRGYGVKQGGLNPLLGESSVESLGHCQSVGKLDVFSARVLSLVRRKAFLEVCPAFMAQQLTGPYPKTAVYSSLSRHFGRTRGARIPALWARFCKSAGYKRVIGTDLATFCDALRRSPLPPESASQPRPNRRKSGRNPHGPDFVAISSDGLRLRASLACRAITRLVAVEVLKALSPLSGCGPL